MAFSILILVICGIIFTFLSFGLMALSYSKTGSAKYSPFSCFPFELNQFKRDQKRSWGLETAFLIGVLCFVFAAAFFIVKNHTKSMAYLIGILLIVDIVVFHVLFFIKLSNYKLHLIFAIIFYLLTFLIYLVEIFIFTNPYSAGFIVSNKVLIWIFTIIGIIFMLIIALNPSYKNWSKMVKVDAQTFYRPKYNYLAGLEWGSFLAYIISFIPLITAAFG